MDFQVQPNRVFLEDPDGRLLAEVTFPDAGDGLVVMNHTFVDDSLRGQGVAGRLVQTAADELRRTGRRVYPTCSYAAGWFQKHPDYADILTHKAP